MDFGTLAALPALVLQRGLAKASRAFAALRSHGAAAAAASASAPAGSAPLAAQASAALRSRRAGSPAALPSASAPDASGSAPDAGAAPHGSDAASSADASPGGAASSADASPSGAGSKRVQWERPLPPHLPGGVGASVEVTAGPRKFARVLHRCVCGTEFDGGSHERGSGGEEAVWWGKTVFCSPACATSAAESQAGESVAVTVSPRRVLPRPPPAASAG